MSSSLDFCEDLCDDFQIPYFHVPIAASFISMDIVFLHIGNIKELILSGNEISSTNGLDRLFSLERLSLDDNKIQHITNIAGIAKLPFLMNFDLKGNPVEIEGVFNDFMERFQAMVEIIDLFIPSVLILCRFSIMPCKSAKLVS